ncbi:MAG: hypothetical protein U0350_22430 [Caldilineaceae bacterium]
MPRLLTDDQLVAELNALDVHFLTGGDGERITSSVTPPELLIGLAQSLNARVRSAIIPLLLIHPAFACHVLQATEQLNEDSRNTLMLFYTATLLLQAKYQPKLKRLLGQYEPLPDLFSHHLCLARLGDIEQRIYQLGERHEMLTQCSANWVGVYEHATKRMIKRLESEAAWQMQLT